MNNKLKSILAFSLALSFISVCTPIKASATLENSKECIYEKGYKLTPENTTLLVIDVQKNFIPGDPNCFIGEIPGQNTPTKLSKVKNLVQFANTNKMSTLVTFESYDSDYAAMPDDILAALPKEKYSKFIKTYFDVTKKANLSETLKNTKTKNVIVCGAETDVCITQSVRGLISKGYNVFLAEDATYTSTTLNAPALKFMQMIGANIYNSDTLINSISNKKPLKSNSVNTLSNNLPDMNYENCAMVIANLDFQSFNKSIDAKKNEKLERFEFMCDFSRISKIPLYIIYNDDIDLLKSNLNIPDNAILIKGKNNLDSVRNILIKSLKDTKKTDIMVSGIDENSLLLKTSMILKGNNLKPYILEDALLNTPENTYKTFYNLGAIPSSLKISFYETVDSIGFEEMPDDIGNKYVKAMSEETMTWIEGLSFVVDEQRPYK